TVEIPCRIRDQACKRISPVPVAKTVRQALSSASVVLPRQLKDHATAIKADAVAADFCSAIQIPRLVEDQAGVGKSPVLAAFEPVQHTLRPGSVAVRHQFEDHATVLIGAGTSVATLRRGTVKVPCLVEDQAR